MSDTEESKINEENTEEKTEIDNEKKTEVVEKFNPKTENGKFKVDC
tara:strand:+ start:683 stop:820 length:138 start_codon:yes stop_codon:yes gene_type:complete